MKEALFNKRIVMIFIIISIFVAIIFVVNSLFSNDGMSKHQWNDIKLSEDLQRAIESYIVLSNDRKLTFGGQNTASVDEILIKLQSDIVIDNKNYGSIFIAQNNPPESYSYYPEWNSTYNGKYFGWKIEVNQKTGRVLVKPSKKNEVIIK